MDNKIYWFDLDHTLWNTNAKWWIVDKNNPAKYLCRINQNEGNLILNGFYKKDNLNFNYNGISGWLPIDLWTKIQRIKPIKLENIGISFREYQDDNLIEKQTANLLVYIDRINHINSDIHNINLLTARGNKNGHTSLLENLYNILNQHNIKINDAIFVNDPTIMPFFGSTSEKKMICILEQIVGYKIKNNSFTPIITNKYNESYFYDDEDKNIETCIVINTFLYNFLENTIPWLKQKIQEDINIRQPKLIINHVTTNELNPFIVTNIDIKC